MATSMWQQTEEMAKKHDQGGSLWLKLAGDGDKAVVVFLGEPHPREVAFVDGKYVEVDEKMKAAGTKASLRVALNANGWLEKGEPPALQLIAVRNEGPGNFHMLHLVFAYRYKVRVV